jgi:hypothetical protein
MGTCGSRYGSDGSWLLQGRNELEGGGFVVTGGGAVLWKEKDQGENDSCWLHFWKTIGFDWSRAGWLVDPMTWICEWIPLCHYVTMLAHWLGILSVPYHIANELSLGGVPSLYPSMVFK